MTEREAIEIFSTTKIVDIINDKFSVSDFREVISFSISALQNQERLEEALKYLLSLCTLEDEHGRLVDKSRAINEAKSALAKKGREMSSTFIMKIFLVEYLICAGFCVAEQNYPRCLYWLMASGLTVSILWGMK